MTKAKYFDLLGSVSTGTLRTEDLAEAVLDGYDTIVRWRIDNMGGEEQPEDPVIAELRRKDFMEWESEDINDVEDIINELCPEGVYFGSHEGDPADIGFWLEEDSDQAEDDLIHAEWPEDDQRLKPYRLYCELALPRLEPAEDKNDEVVTIERREGKVVLMVGSCAVVLTPTEASDLTGYLQLAANEAMEYSE